MKARTPVAIVAAAGLAVGGAACALDFNRFQSASTQTEVDSSAPPGADGGSSEPTPEEASVDVSTAPPEYDGQVADAGPDVGSIADASPEASSCTPSSSCLDQARNCGMNCASQEQLCTSQCSGGSCRFNCMRTENMCIGQCQSSCSNCVRSGGCNVTAACADAAAP